MARIRSVKPDLFKSTTLRRVTIEVRYFAVGLITEADDEGRFVASSKALVGSLFPHDDDVSATKVERWLRSLEDVGMIELYEWDGVRYGCFPKWASHQRISHPTPSKLPNASGEIPEPLQNGSARNREQGTGNREQGSGTETFERFFTAYPSARKGSRREVGKAWDKAIERANPEDIILAAIAFAADPNRVDEYTPGAARWLNRDGWEEGPLPKRRGEPPADKEPRDL